MAQGRLAVRPSPSPRAFVHADRHLRPRRSAVSFGRAGEEEASEACAGRVEQTCHCWSCASSFRRRGSGMRCAPGLTGPEQRAPRPRTGDGQVSVPSRARPRAVRERAREERVVQGLRGARSPALAALDAGVVAGPAHGDVVDVRQPPTGGSSSARRRGRSSTRWSLLLFAQWSRINGVAASPSACASSSPAGAPNCRRDLRRTLVAQRTQARPSTPPPMRAATPLRRRASLAGPSRASGLVGARRTRSATATAPATDRATARCRRPVRPRPVPPPSAYPASPSPAPAPVDASRTRSATQPARATARAPARTTAPRSSASLGNRSRAAARAAASRARPATATAWRTARAFASATAARSSAKPQATARISSGPCPSSAMCARTVDACTGTACSGSARRASAVSRVARARSPSRRPPPTGSKAASTSPSAPSR
jgi:hypothetical protein